MSSSAGNVVFRRKKISALVLFFSSSFANDRGTPTDRHKGLVPWRPEAACFFFISGQCSSYWIFQQECLKDLFDSVL
jgi:hypothetical protein